MSEGLDLYQEAIKQMAAAARASVGPKEARDVVLAMADPVMLDLL